MKSRSFDPDKYQQSSPKQLNGLPRVSVLLRRARGLTSSTRTPTSSTASPLVGRIGCPVLTSAPIKSRSRSSSVSPAKYGPPCIAWLQPLHSHRRSILESICLTSNQRRRHAPEIVAWIAGLLARLHFLRRLREN